MLKIIKTYVGTNFVTGLRAYAATAVLLIHTGGAGIRDLGSIGNEIVNFCQNGVMAFFVISGFSIASTIKPMQKFSNYFLLRLIRITPLYFFWVILVFILAGNYSNYQLYNLSMHLTYLSFLDYKVANSILGVEWSIPIEIFYYLLLPTLIILFSKKYFYIVFSIFALIFYIQIHRIFEWLPFNSDKRLILKYSPLPYLLAFSLGISAYLLQKKVKIKNIYSDIGVISVLILLILYFAIPGFNIYFYDDFIFTCLITFILLTFSSDTSFLVKMLFNNRLVLYVGTISYGIYLCHLQVFYRLGELPLGVVLNSPFEKFTLCFFYSALVATLLMRFFEIPTIRFLKRRIVTFAKN